MITPLSPQQVRKLESDLTHEKGWAPQEQTTSRIIRKSLITWRHYFMQWGDHAVPYFCQWIRDILTLLHQQSPSLVTRCIDIIKEVYPHVPCDTPIPKLMYELAKKVYYQEYQFPQMVGNRDHKNFIKLLNLSIKGNALPPLWKTTFLQQTPYVTILNDIEETGASDIGTVSYGFGKYGVILLAKNALSVTLNA